MTGQGVDYTADCLFDYVYFKNYYKMVAIDLSKQQALDVDPKAIQQINFTANIERAGNTTIVFTRNFESIIILFCFNII